MIGILKKMQTTWSDPHMPVAYALSLGDTVVSLNEHIGTKINLHFTGKCRCIACGREIKKTFQQGYCFPCTQKLAETDFCILKPELCHHHLGTCRDAVFAEQHCFIPHIVYLALSSGVKVGITRAHQKLTRWADQGATSAIELAIVPNRRTAGLVEVAIAKHIPDKTNWRKMLTSEGDSTDLLKLKTAISAKIPKEFQSFLTTTEEIFRLKYPVTTYPLKVNSVSFDKNPDIEGKLIGIKGQYLILASGSPTTANVLNLRKHQGYEIRLEWGE